jgi:hypothetical protein
MTTREDAWTQPSHWCTAPHQWHADDTEATEHEVSELAAGFVRALQPHIVIETGTYRGQTSLAIGQALVENGHGHLFTIEADPVLAANAELELAAFPVSVICADASAWLAEPHFSPRVGFAWIDSGILATRPNTPTSRGYEASRAAEIERLLPYCEPGAIIGVHDTGPQHPVLASLQPLFGAGALLPGITLRTPRGVTFAQVPVT